MQKYFTFGTTLFHIPSKPLIFISYLQGYVKVQQIYESHLFLLGRYTLNSGIYVKINENLKI